MPHISPEEARARLACWAALARHEIAELRDTDVLRKARQLDAQFASRDLFPAHPEAEHEAAALAERWSRIRAAARG